MKFILILIVTGLVSFLTTTTQAAVGCKDSVLIDRPPIYILSPTVKVRERRDSFEESLQTEVEIDRTMKELLSLVRLSLGPDIGLSDIEVVQYGQDTRIDWDTYVIFVNGSPFGFSDGYIPFPKELLN